MGIVEKDRMMFHDCVESRSTVLTYFQRYCAHHSRFHLSRIAIQLFVIPMAMLLIAGCTDFEAQERLAESNRQQGEAFLSANRGKEGIVVRPSGLQYKVLRQGSGPKPTLSDRVTVHYRGTLIDGTEFDSSYARGEPTTFAVAGVIPGWTEGLQLMSVGSHYYFFVPSDLAYGYKGAGDDIGPNATLIFEVELLEING